MKRYISLLTSKDINDGLASLMKTPGCLAADLHSTIDTALISAFYNSENIQPVKILEIGGGYGRLFETLRYYTGAKFEYVLVDAVPNSLLFAYLYLKRHYPGLKIGIPYNGDIYKEGEWDVFVMPSWKTAELKDCSFDIGINIDSFQEMNEFHVNTFINLLDKKVRAEGLIYLSNSRDYRYTGDYNYPLTWECHFMHRTPRSWTRHHPTEIFIKSSSDASAINNIRKTAYISELRLAELLNPDLIKVEANLRAVVPSTPLKCTLRWQPTPETHEGPILPESATR